MGWVEPEAFGLFCPLFADGFEGCEALQRFEPAGAVVGIDEVSEMASQLRVIIVVEAFDGVAFLVEAGIEAVGLRGMTGVAPASRTISWKCSAS